VVDSGNYRAVGGGGGGGGGGVVYDGVMPAPHYVVSRPAMDGEVVLTGRGTRSSGVVLSSGAVQSSGGGRVVRRVVSNGGNYASSSAAARNTRVVSSSSANNQEYVSVNNRQVRREEQDICRPGDACWGAVKCICNICECGNHRCPIHDTRAPKATRFEGVTEAQAEYVKKRAAVVQRAVRQERRVESGKFYGDTEAATAFTEYQVQAPAQREPAKYVPSGLKFHGVTENHAQYTEKEARATRAVATHATDNLTVRAPAPAPPPTHTHTHTGHAVRYRTPALLCVRACAPITHPCLPPLCAWVPLLAAMSCPVRAPSRSVPVGSKASPPPRRSSRSTTSSASRPSGPRTRA